MHNQESGGGGGGGLSSEQTGREEKDTNQCLFHSAWARVHDTDRCVLVNPFRSPPLEAWFGALLHKILYSKTLSV